VKSNIPSTLESISKEKQKITSFPKNAGQKSRITKENQKRSKET